MSRIGVDRVLKFAFELAQSRPKKHLTSATKSNGIAITMPYWDERVAEMAKAYPGVKLDKFHIDILTAHFVQRPDFFDVVVASNLFGDILATWARPAPAPSASRPAPTSTRTAIPLAVRAGARLGARHLRQEHRQPDRPDLVRRDDAGVPGPQGGARRDPEGDRKVLDPKSGAPRTADIGGKAAPPTWARRSPRRCNVLLNASRAMRAPPLRAPRARARIASACCIAACRIDTLRQWL
jgi:tartrate dehydrogenase/decarboxylase/D-malate dehydrogenase